jgi:RecT family
LTESETALATREFSDAAIKRRIEAARAPGFGLDKASQAQLNIIFLLAQRYDLDVVTDITLFQGKPWVTLDGRLRMLRRHPDFRGVRTRPLDAETKKSWGYADDDLVVEATVLTRRWGEVVARGKVSAEEMRRNTPTGTHPTEMAEKRAIARAARLAFGQEVPDEDEAAIQIIERTRPDVVRANAQRYDEIFGKEDRQVDTTTGEVLEEAPVAEPVDEKTLARNAELVLQAFDLGVPGLRRLSATSNWTLEQTRAANVEIEERVRSRNADLDQEAAKQTGQQQFA